jgi:hypothetical protein
VALDDVRDALPHLTPNGIPRLGACVRRLIDRDMATSRYLKPVPQEGMNRWQDDGI